MSTVGTLQKGDFVVLDIEAADKMKPTACALSLATTVCCAALLRGCGPSLLWDDQGRITRAPRGERLEPDLYVDSGRVSCGAMLLTHVALLCAWVCGCVVL